MTKPDKRQPERAPETASERVAREQRLAAALRENLRRRKEQSRGRRPEPASQPSPSGSEDPRDA